MQTTRREFLLALGTSPIVLGCATRSPGQPSFASFPLPLGLDLSRSDALVAMRARDAYCLVLRVPTDERTRTRLADELLRAVDGSSRGIATPALLKRCVLLCLPHDLWPGDPERNVVQIDAEGTMLGATQVDWTDYDASVEGLHVLLDATEREERRRAPEDPRFEAGHAEFERLWASSDHGVGFASPSERDAAWRRFELAYTARSWLLWQWRSAPESEAARIVGFFLGEKATWSLSEQRGRFGPLPFGTRLEARDVVPDGCGYRERSMAPSLLACGIAMPSLRARYLLRFLGT